jgi:hypothetical protein
MISVLFLLGNAESGAHPFEVAAWEAAIIGTIVSLPLAIAQFLYTLKKQRRDQRIEQAKFGYELLDSVFEDEWAGDLLYSLDGSYEKAGRPKGSAARAQDFIAVFKNGDSLPEGRSLELHSRVDALLYYLDRFEHAIRADLTTFDTLHTPTAYYVRLLSEYKPRLSDYIARVGYSRVLALFGRFSNEWGN